MRINLTKATNVSLRNSVPVERPPEVMDRQ